MIEYVEMPDALAAKLKDAKDRANELADQFRAAESFHQQLLDDAVASIAEFKVGQDVISYGKRYRITKVKGEQFGLSGHAPKVWLRYYGERLKVDGSPMGRERRLYELHPQPEQEGK